MARSWSELLGEENAAPEPEEARGGMFSRLRESLSKSRRALTEQIAAAAFDPGDDEAWERLEEALIQADVGVGATAELVRRLEERGELGDLGEALAAEIQALFGEAPTLAVGDRPERAPAGAPLRRGRGRHRRRVDEARRLGQGRDRRRDRVRAGPAREADRRGGAARRSAPVRRRRLRARTRRRVTRYCGWRRA